MLLRAAIAEMGAAADPLPSPGPGAVADRAVLVRYLEFLLPDIDTRSASAARTARQSISILKRADAAAPNAVAALH